MESAGGTVGITSLPPPNTTGTSTPTPAGRTELERRSSADALLERLLDDELLVSAAEDDITAAETEEKEEDRGGPRTWLRGMVVTVLLAIAAALAVVLIGGHEKQAGAPSPHEAACTVFCHGRILQTIQSAGLWSDSKTFVDMPLMSDPKDVNDAFVALFGSNPHPPRDELASFVAQYFQPAGLDTLPWVPDDWTMSPSLLRRLQNDTLRQWALGLNDLWLQLGRQIVSTVRDYPQRFTLLWQPHGMIVPGGRFLESYYWDTLWVVHGLLHSGMTRTAMGVTLNLVHLLETFGFVPNGGRLYYALPGRSQPPMLSSMVRAIFEETGNVTFLSRCYAAVKTEYSWFMREGAYGHAVAVYAGGGDAGTAGAAAHGGDATRRRHLLNRYITDQHLPRPESWAEDVHTVREAGWDSESSEAQLLYSEIAAAAESGWDFSSRWFADGQGMGTTSTSQVIPVELNAILFRVEKDLAYFARVLASVAEQECGAGEAMGAPAAAPLPHSTHGPRRSQTQPQQRHDGRAAPSGGVLPGHHSDTAAAAARGPRPEGLAPWSIGEAGDETERRCEGLVHYHCPSPDAAGCLAAMPATMGEEGAVYEDAASERLAAMEALLWDGASSQWRDLRILSPVTQQSPPLGAAGGRGAPADRARAAPAVGDLVLGLNVAFSNVTSVSNWTPLWAGAYNASDGARVAAVRRSLLDSGLLQDAGLAATTSRTAQQWDFPNGWAPSNHMMILGLLETGEPESCALAREIARRWLASGFTAYRATGFMYEKYSVTQTGAGGGGGEYVPQLGFGFTNGVALDLLMRFRFTDLEPPGA